jgi:phosphoribosylformimino-5-aminoimidazole carboxamide ribotide isomerase
LHVVDLDAAAGAGTNRRIVYEAVQISGLEMQVGGGLCDADSVYDALDSGARWAVVSARMVPHADVIAELASTYPDELILSVSVSGRRLETDPFTRSTLPRNALDLAEELRDVPIAAILIRAIDREGHLGGPDLRLIEDLVEAVDVPVLAAGGVGSLAHLRNLEDRGAAGTIIGTAFHLGLLNPTAVAAEFPA